MLVLECALVRGVQAACQSRHAWRFALRSAGCSSIRHLSNFLLCEKPSSSAECSV